MRTLASYLDKDEDGMVTRYEVVEVWMNTLLQRLFKAFDLDGSGGTGLSFLIVWLFVWLFVCLVVWLFFACCKNLGL